MEGINQPEPPLLLERISSLDAKKIRFEINRIQLPIGIKSTFGMICHPGASLAVPITNEGHVVILRQYRFAVGRRILEFPAGTLEEGEDPLESMKRELAEEAGYKASCWESLGEMLPCPGYSNELIHLYLAKDLMPIPEPPKGDEDEDLEVLHMKFEELENLLTNRKEVLDGKSLTAWYLARQFLQSQKI